MVGVLGYLEVYIATLYGQSLFAPLATHKGVTIAVVARDDPGVFLDGVVEDSAFQSWFLRGKPYLELSAVFLRPIHEGQGPVHEHVHDRSLDLYVVITHFVMIKVLVEFLRNTESCREHRVIRLFG